MLDHTSKYVTLVLNYAYQPVRIINWQKAIELVYLKKAQVLSEYSQVVRSQFEEWKIPAVIQIPKVYRYSMTVKFNRDLVYARDSWTCQYCGKEYPARLLTFDHVLPKSKGGPRTWENIVSACKDCNSKKDRMTPGEAKMPLRAKPRKPRWLPRLLVKSFGANVPVQWLDYVKWLRPEDPS